MKQSGTETYTDAAGNDYEVPCYVCPAGLSVNDAARKLQGVIPARSTRQQAIWDRKVFAAITDSGHGLWPVIYSDAIPPTGTVRKDTLGWSK